MPRNQPQLGNKYKQGMMRASQTRYDCQRITAQPGLEELKQETHGQFTHPCASMYEEWSGEIKPSVLV